MKRCLKLCDSGAASLPDRRHPDEDRWRFLRTALVNVLRQEILAPAVIIVDVFWGCTA